MSNQPPIEVPQGAIRLNTDSQKLEFYAQDRWHEMATDVPTLDGGTRGIIASGLSVPGSSGATNIDFYNNTNTGKCNCFWIFIIWKRISWWSCIKNTRNIYKWSK